MQPSAALFVPAISRAEVKLHGRLDCLDGVQQDGAHRVGYGLSLHNPEQGKAYPTETLLVISLRQIPQYCCCLASSSSATLLPPLHEHTRYTYAIEDSDTQARHSVSTCTRKRIRVLFLSRCVSISSCLYSTLACGGSSCSDIMLSVLSQLRQLLEEHNKAGNSNSADLDSDEAYKRDGTLANHSGLNLFETMDEEELVIDSPEQEPVEDEDLEDVDDNLKLGQPAAAAPKPVKDKDGNREQVSVTNLALQGIASRPDSALTPRFCAWIQFLTYPESLPYECETLAEMDAQLDIIVSKICQAVQARDYDSTSIFVESACP